MCQLAANTNPVAEKELQNAGVDAWKLCTGFSFDNSACGAGRTYTVAQHFGRKIRRDGRGRGMIEWIRRRSLINT